MKITRIIDGIMVFDGDEFVGRMVITDEVGGHQLHCDNLNASSIRAFRIAKEFLKDKGKLFSGCFKHQEHLKRVMLMLGFKQINEINNVCVFVKE